MRRLTCMIALGVWLATTPVGAADSPPASDDIRNPVVMTVNGEEIRAADISMVMLNIRGAVERAGKTVESKELLEVASQRVIEQKLLAQEARRFGLQADSGTVTRLLTAAENQAGGADRLAANLAATGSSLAELRSMLVEVALAQQFIKTRIEPTVKVSEDAIERYYADHAEDFTVADRIRPRHIVFAVAHDADDATVERIRQKAVAARQRVLAGEPFADVARDVSEGPSAARGGDIGLVPLDALEPEFAAAALDLAPGEISDIVRTPFGFHIITVDERQPAGIRPLAEVRDMIATQLHQPATAETVAALLRTLVEKANIDVARNLPTPPPADGE